MVKQKSTPVLARQPGKAVKPVLKVPVSAVQRAWLLAMGVDVPWIVSETSPQKKAAVSQSQVAPATAAKPASLPPKTVANEAQNIVEAKTDTPAVPVDLSGLDLADLRDRIMPCRACGLCESRTHAVAGEGAESPDVLIVGEAPGEQEDSEGKPFVGRSGQLLDNMLQAIGLDRANQVFITNVIKCRPPANRNPRQEEIAACLPYLHQQIAVLQPKVVLAMGRFAAHALLNTSEPLQALRQKTQVLADVPDTPPVVVTYHPAYLLRRPVDKRLAWEDLKQVTAHLMRA